MELNRREMLKSAALAGAGVTAVGGASAADEAKSSAADDIVAVVVTIEVKPGRQQEFLDLLRPVLDAMRHEKTFINAVLHQDPEDPTRFMIYETWADRRDLVEVQVNREYRRAYMDGLSELLRSPRGIQVWAPMRSDFAFFAERGT